MATRAAPPPASLLRDAFEFSPREIVVLAVARLANHLGAFAAIRPRLDVADERDRSPPKPRLPR